MSKLIVCLIILFSVDVFAQDGGGACPRLERERIGSCGISVADPCHSGSQCVCVKCGERRVQKIPEIKIGQCIASREVCRDNGPEIPPTCTTVCDLRAPPICNLVDVPCVRILETLPQPVPHRCEDPCPPCPPEFSRSCEGVACGPADGTCP